MAAVNTSVLVPHSAARMFALVDDVESYPAFLPWCSGADVEFKDPGVTRATLHINYHGIRQSFTTENAKDEPRRMQIRLLRGPFKSLEGEWRFTELGGDGCKIEFSLRYEFSGRLLSRLLGPVFEHIANTLVEAFVKRARALNA
jgi:ribosome-associated toxin RatA of RatAB toxin-antitoxin module